MAQTDRPGEPDARPIRTTVRQAVDHAVEIDPLDRAAVNVVDPHNRAHRCARPNAERTVKSSKPSIWPTTIWPWISIQACACKRPPAALATPILSWPACP